MQTLKIIHCADAHLGSDIRSLGHLGARRKMEIRQSFFQILKLCEEEGADLLLIAGDLFDQPTPEPELVHQVIEQMEKYLRPEFLFLRATTIIFAETLVI